MPNPTPNPLAVTISMAAMVLLVLMAGTPPLADSLTASSANDSAERQVPAYLIEVPASVADVLIADAQGAELLRFVNTESGIEALDSRYMSVGQNGVGKQRAWDKKTPLGIYFITEELDTSKLAARYGMAAFVLDYPNAWDVVNERTGYGIWLHGVDPNLDRRPRRDTDGCLALPNEELLAISDRLQPNVTPVIIARELSWVSAGEVEALRRELRAALESWRASLERQDPFAYLSLYDDSFESRGMNKQQWAAFKLGVFEARELQGIHLDDVLLLGDPEVPGLYLSRFEQTLQTADGEMQIRKRLYWHRGTNGWRIVSEDVG